MRTCYKCGSASGKQSLCKPCGSAYRKRHYHRNKASYHVATRASKVKRRAAADVLKDSPCLDCGVWYPPYVMQFDHVAPNKIAGVSALVRTGTLKQVLTEIDKCELVCGNCHAERTHQRACAILAAEQA